MHAIWTWVLMTRTIPYQKFKVGTWVEQHS